MFLSDRNMLIVKEICINQNVVVLNNLCGRSCEVRGSREPVAEWPQCSFDHVIIVDWMFETLTSIVASYCHGHSSAVFTTI